MIPCCLSFSKSTELEVLGFKQGMDSACFALLFCRRLFLCDKREFRVGASVMSGQDGLQYIWSGGLLIMALPRDLDICGSAISLEETRHTDSCDS